MMTAMHPRKHASISACDPLSVSLLSTALNSWLGQLREAFPPLYLVGGSVRDLLLCRKPKDMDLVCRRAEGFARKLADINDAALVRMEKKAGEPCYRVVERGSGNNFLDIAELRGETIEEDLRRRDFTINAMAAEISGEGGLGELIDPFGGREDLEAGVIRTPSEESFLSDPLRILRAVRFAAELGFAIDSTAQSRMALAAPLLARVSAERIVAELLLILDTPRSFTHFQFLDRLSILQVVFPEIQAMKGCTQNSLHHRDVWNHSLTVMENCETILWDLPGWFGGAGERVMENLEHNHRGPLLKLAALLHDVGKPATRRINPGSPQITFYGHDSEGARVMDAIGERLKLSHRDRTYLSLLVAEHLKVLNLSTPEVNSATRMRWFRDLMDDAIPVIILGMADIKGTLSPESTEAARIRHVEWLRSAVEEYFTRVREHLARPRLVTGNDLIGLGMKPGPDMGRVLQHIDDARIAGEIEDRESALALARHLLGLREDLSLFHEGRSTSPL